MPYKDKEKEREAKKRYEEKRKAENGARHRGWMMIFYPDSVVPEWKEYLSGLHLRIWVSPLHDKDCWNAADERENSNHKAGTPKKPHYHLIVEYPIQVDRKTFLEDMKGLNGNEYVKSVRDLTAMIRYLIHLDDHDKAQYSRDDISVFGGAEKDAIDQLGSHERHEELRAMRKFIRDNCVIDFCDFCDYCDDMQKSWALLLDDNSSYIIEKYIKSLRAKLRDEVRQTPVVRVVQVDNGTGEVVGQG